jgi:hypothetical protein
VSIYDEMYAGRVGEPQAAEIQHDRAYGSPFRSSQRRFGLWVRSDIEFTEEREMDKVFSLGHNGVDGKSVGGGEELLNSRRHAYSLVRRAGPQRPPTLRRSPAGLLRVDARDSADSSGARDRPLADGSKNDKQNT